MRAIAVLEDDPFRNSQMKIAARELSDHQFRWFFSAYEMIEWLARNLRSVELVSLDYDLDSTALEGTDCGSGDDVVAFLISQSIRLRVLVHSSNALRAPAMHLDLILAGFKAQLCPFTDAAQWISDIRRANSSGV